MVELGEAAGKLEQVMSALSLYYERGHALKTRSNRPCSTR